MELRSGDKILYEQTLDISPEKPFVKEVALPVGVTNDSLKAVLVSGANRELISYSPVKPRNLPVPEPVEPPPAPKDIKTIEELYLTGLRLEQFHNPVIEPYPYYEEALRRDPGDYRVNTQLGILYCKRGMFARAEDHLNTAIERGTRNYTSPKDGEAFYYLGVARQSEGKLDLAYDAFYKATWSNAWRSAAYFQLAQICSRRGDFKAALEHMDRSLALNTLSTSALNLKTSLLRRSGRLEDAKRQAVETREIDPLNFYAGNELYLIERQSGSSAALDLDELKAEMRDDPQSYLEVAIDYANAGLLDESIDLLLRLDTNNQQTYAMVYYFLGYFQELEGNAEGADKYYRLGSSMPRDYVFPFRWEAGEVLRHAIAHNSQDARAEYYLGNLLYDQQPESAISAWEKSVALDPSFATAHRNLGLAYARILKNDWKAISSLEKAIQCDKTDGRLFLELDQIYERAGVNPEKRLAVLEQNQQAVLQRDDAVEQEVVLYLLTQQCDKAIDLLTRRHFHTWEGGADFHDVYISALLLRGRKLLVTKNYVAALSDFQMALLYPDNLEVGRPRIAERDAEIHYFIGAAYEALGNTNEAKKAFAMATTSGLERSPARYFQGLAMRKLHREDDATAAFTELATWAQSRLDAGGEQTDFFAKFGEQHSASEIAAQTHYLLGLGLLGQGKRVAARAEFASALAQNLNHLGAKTELEALESN